MKKRKGFKLVFDFQLDFQFWAIIPAVNLNFHGFTFEIEWLCLALYISSDKSEINLTDKTV